MDMLNHFIIMTHQDFDELENKTEQMYLLTDANGIIDEIKVISNNRVIIFREGKTLTNISDFEPKLYGVINKKIGESITFPKVEDFYEEYTNYIYYYFFDNWYDSEGNLTSFSVPNYNQTLYAKRYKLEVPKVANIQVNSSGQSMITPFKIISNHSALNFKPVYLFNGEIEVKVKSMKELLYGQYYYTIEFEVDDSLIGLGNTIELSDEIEVYIDQKLNSILGKIKINLNVHQSDAPTGD